MDKDTKQLLTDGEKLKQLTEHEGWAIAYQKFSDKIMDLQFIANVDNKDPNTAFIDMKARMYAVSLLLDWMKSDILGVVEQHNLNNNLSKPVRSYIVRDEM